VVAAAHVGTAHRGGWNDVVWTVRRAPIESIGPEGLPALFEQLHTVSALLEPAVAALLAHRAQDQRRIARYEILCRQGGEPERAFMWTMLRRMGDGGWTRPAGARH